MAKLTEEKRKVYNEQIASYQQQIDALLISEKNMLMLLEKDSSGAAYKKLILTDDMLYLSTLYLAKHSVSVSILGIKNEDALNDARKTLYKAVIYLEEVVSNYIDVPYSDYADKVDEIKNLPESKRYYLIRKLGLAIRLVTDAYGDNTKWRWTFVELEARFATVAKNILDLKTASKDGLDPHSPDYDDTVYHLRLVKRLLQQAADRYREKYELSTGRIDDFRLGINYLLALRRIHLILNERAEADEAKRKAEIWQEKMEKDHKKTESRKK
ncbi:hypothetical protein K7I13_14530 [Brucepastera parasyntrophica]|uniref:hypothetical protein n=1 Tax=Brucepastera parasyntrophica TaxID=2880008 RepID=UPI00210F032A|nr:hypothetical protein [Brucepastera parasyntrophica]ULQ59651.1 hypothetical protein K7I13_14530 [Brucepastera parasyntrophica]